ncbi:MAG TPA: hypothetical protein VMI06_18830 [Terriglobia bacterium]|nr:hypothetical protein [Terriglobia bacterium]
MSHSKFPQGYSAPKSQVRSGSFFVKLFVLYSLQKTTGVRLLSRSLVALRLRVSVFVCFSATQQPYACAAPPGVMKLDLNLAIQRPGAGLNCAVRLRRVNVMREALI